MSTFRAALGTFVNSHEVLAMLWNTQVALQKHTTAITALNANIGIAIKDLTNMQRIWFVLRVSFVNRDERVVSAETGLL